MPDEWEIKHGLDPNKAAATSADTDGDGWPDLEKWLEGTDPRR